jgi:hypothetical protein
MSGRKSRVLSGSLPASFTSAPFFPSSSTNRESFYVIVRRNNRWNRHSWIFRPQLSLAVNLSTPEHEVYSMCILVAAHLPLRKNDPPEEAAMNINEAVHETISDEKDERRRHSDRRKRSIPVAVERRSGKDRRLEEKSKGLEGERRRQVDPTTCEKDYNEDEIAFMQAMDLYKRRNRRPFPTWSEVLEVLISLGYRKVEAATALPGVPVQPKQA